MKFERLKLTLKCALRVINTKILLGFIVFSIAAIQTHSHAQEEITFKVWLDELRTDAKKKGYKEKSINLAFSDIKEPVERSITNDRNQPEVIESYAEYLDGRVSEWRIENGKKLLKKHQDLLQKIAGEYGVQPRFIVAIWGMETNYGTVILKESVFSVLATLAYDKRRADFFRAQFFDAITILDRDFAPFEKMKSSWAGALGQCQFIPENYLKYAVDYDKDGKRDIWDTEADIFASIANYISLSGWKGHETWGRRVLLPAVPEEALFEKRPGDIAPLKECQRYKDLVVWRDLQEWKALGVRRLNGDNLPPLSMLATLITGDPDDNMGYIAYRNFCSIMKFNPSFKYALSIGLLADHFIEE